MTVDLSIRIPFGYGTSYKTLAEAQAILARHYHPEYVRRLIPWLASKNGHVGIGGHWRATGTQPDRFGFAPEGKSFHQDQRYADGFVGACAVDLVVGVPGRRHRAPFWSEVPKQGSSEARLWGVHANVSTESWHMQPVEIDGHASWLRAGRPFPRPGYPLPVASTVAPAPAPVDLSQVPFSRTLKVGSSGVEVKAVQQKLKEAGFNPGPVDGQFGPATGAAVVKFQQVRSLTVDGLVGKRTWGALGLPGGISSPAPEPVRNPVTASYTTRPGDSWWSIAQIAYGTGTLWGKIASANNDSLNRQGPRGEVVIPNVKFTEVVPGDGWISVSARMGRSDWRSVRSQNSHISVLQPGNVVFGGQSNA